MLREFLNLEHFPWDFPRKVPVFEGKTGLLALDVFEVKS
jgi:hypothetical protein